MIIPKRLDSSDVDIIKRYEGYKADWYRDGGGVLTIGYGHTGELPEGFTPPLSEDDATRLLLQDLAIYESAVNHSVKVEISKEMFASLVSLCYNIGVGAFNNSTLLRMLNHNDVYGAANQFLRWNKDNGVIVAGLTNRRADERNLFLTGWDDEIKQA